MENGETLEGGIIGKPKFEDGKLVKVPYISRDGTEVLFVPQEGDLEFSIEDLFIGTRPGSSNKPLKSYMHGDGPRFNANYDPRENKFIVCDSKKDSTEEHSFED